MASHNPGFITGSTCSAIMTGKDPDKLLVGGESFAIRLALERSGICQFEESFKGNSATEWGNMYEAEAIQVYEALTFSEVFGKQEGVSYPDKWLACTPDGLTIDRLIEVKCPEKSEIHWENWKDPQKFARGHYDQLQFNMRLCRKNLADLISYSPNFTEPFNIKIVTVQIDTAWQEKFTKRLALVDEIIKNEIALIKKHQNI